MAECTPDALLGTAAWRRWLTGIVIAIALVLVWLGFDGSRIGPRAAANGWATVYVLFLARLLVGSRRQRWRRIRRQSTVGSRSGTP